jgi:hypothetical protein
VINIFAGDSIMFEANAQDANGTAIGSAIGSLTVINHFGTTVLATSVTHTSNGTYQFQVPSTLNWALGPLQERWKFFSSIGTTTFVANDNFRLVGTGQLDTYISAEELVSYYENIVDYFDGSEDAIIADAFSGINARLEALGCKLPFAPKADGRSRTRSSTSTGTTLPVKAESGLQPRLQEAVLDRWRPTGVAMWAKASRMPAMSGTGLSG